MSTKPRISSWISKTNASLSQIASETGKSKTTVRKYLRGEVVCPDFYTCVAVALAAFDSKDNYVHFIKYYGFCRGRCHPLLADVKNIADDYYSIAYNMNAAEAVNDLKEKLPSNQKMNKMKDSYFDEDIDSSLNYEKYLDAIFVPPEVVLLYGFDAEKDPTEVERAIKNLCAAGNQFFPYVEKNIKDLLHYLRYTNLRGKEKEKAKREYHFTEDSIREMQNAYDTLHTLRKFIYRRR